MTQEQFSSLQELHRLSGLSLVKFLQRETPSSAESVCACKGVNPASDSVMSKYPHSCLCIAFISHIV